jgi:hypothetical protein
MGDISLSELPWFADPAPRLLADWKTRDTEAPRYLHRPLLATSRLLAPVRLDRFGDRPG